MGVMLDKRGRAVMAALAAGRALSDTPPALVDELVRHDLARLEAGRLVATAAGCGWSARAAAPDAPNRLLAERRLPVADGGRGRRVTVNLAESPLGWLKARGHVDARQYEAGERIRSDWETAQLAPRVTMRWELAPSRGAAAAAPEPGGAQLAAQRRFAAATAAVGPGLADILWRVACAGEGLEPAERALGWPKRSAKLVLGLALDRLGDHYQLK